MDDFSAAIRPLTVRFLRIAVLDNTGREVGEGYRLNGGPLCDDNNVMSRLRGLEHDALISVLFAICVAQP